MQSERGEHALLEVLQGLQFLLCVHMHVVCVPDHCECASPATRCIPGHRMLPVSLTLVGRWSSPVVGRKLLCLGLREFCYRILLLWGSPSCGFLSLGFQLAISSASYGASLSVG